MLSAVSDTPKPRGGRPPLPPEVRLSETLKLRVTKREADAVYQLAIKHGVSLNAVLRTILQRLIDRHQ